MKIVVATTFRDFKGNDNDRIQYLFLENLRKQTFKDFILAVTTFGEKRVADVVKEQLGMRVVVKNVDSPGDFRFSLTDVILTGMDVAKQLKDECVLVWCTCDVILKEDFLQKIVEFFKPGFAGIVHPNILYDTVEDMKCNRGTLESLNNGIDLLFFDIRVLETARLAIEEYRFLGWGVFEWFLGLVALKYATLRVNLLGATNIGKIANNRKLTNESLQYFAKCSWYNKKILEKYIHDTGLVKRIGDAIGLNCHLRYDLVVPVPGYDNMLAEAKKHHFRIWLLGKMRGLRCRLYKLFKLGAV